MWTYRTNTRLVSTGGDRLDWWQLAAELASRLSLCARRHGTGVLAILHSTPGSRVQAHPAMLCYLKSLDRVLKRAAGRVQYG